ncbi:MAG TPA: ABC transporter substrate-binding protein [Polyangia bacterium]
MQPRSDRSHRHHALAGALLLGLALSACSLDRFEHQECTSNQQCRAALGFGAVCGDEGLCVEAPKTARCASTYPDDLFTNPERHRDTVVLGSLMDRSAAAHVVREKATRLAVKQANAQGGLDGHRVALVMCDIREDSNLDDQKRTAAAISSANHLARVLGVPAIIGPSASADVEQVWQALRDAGSLVMSPAATSPTLSNLEGNTSNDSPGLLWRAAPDDSGQGRVIADDMLERKVSRAIVIREVGAYGEGLAGVFAERFRRGGGNLELVSISSVEQARNAGAMNISDEDPAEVLFISSQQAWIVEYLKAASAQTTFDNRTLFLTDAAANQSVLTDAGATNLYPRVRGTRPAPRDSSDYVFASFIADYRAEYQDMSPTAATFSAHAFDATWLTLYGAAASLFDEGRVTGAGISRGLRRMSSGKEVSIVPASWPGVVASFRAKQTMNVRGASGDLDYHPQTRQLVSPIEIWTISANGGQFAMVPLSVRTPRD